MPLTTGKAAFVEAVCQGRPRLVLEVGKGIGQATAAIAARVPTLVTVDVDPAMRPHVVADARRLPFARPFEVACSDSLLNLMGSSLDRVLEELMRLADTVVLREWLPPTGNGSRDKVLLAMLEARRRDGEDYELHGPDAVVHHFSEAGWSTRLSVHHEPADAQVPVPYPLAAERHADLLPDLAPEGPGISSSWVLTARRTSGQT